MRAALALAALVALSPSCAREVSPEGQLLIFVTTDAPVGPGGPTALFDRMRVELVLPGEREPCAGCMREFALDDDRMARGEASFGFFPRAHTPGYRARVRVFRSGGTASGEPRRASTLESTVTLPEVAAQGVVEITVMLDLADLARPRGSLDAPMNPGEDNRLLDYLPDQGWNFVDVAPTALIRHEDLASTDLLGPAPMFRVRNKYRRRLLTKAQDREATVAAIGAAVERLAADRALKDVAIGVDVDPQ